MNAVENYFTANLEKAVCCIGTSAVLVSEPQTLLCPCAIAVAVPPSLDESHKTKKAILRTRQNDDSSKIDFT